MKEFHARHGIMPIADRVGGRDNNFNLLRMLAATGVLISHAYPISLGDGSLEPLTVILKGKTLGWVCVTIFFAISGFFIARSFANKASLRAFLRARALRLFPGLMAVLVITIIVGSFLSTASHHLYWTASAEYFWRNLTLFSLRYDLPGVFLNNPYGPAINGSLWTLIYEVLCYLGVIFVGIVGLLSRPRAYIVFLIGFGAACGLVMITDLPPRIETLISLGIPFVTGMTLWVWRNYIPLSFGVALAGGALSLLLWPTPLFQPVFSCCLSYAIFVLGYANTPKLRVYNQLGDYSYGTYIYAFPIQQLVIWWGVTGPLMNIVVSVPLTLFFAVLSWHLIEAPALKLR